MGTDVFDKTLTRSRIYDDTLKVFITLVNTIRFLFWVYTELKRPQLWLHFEYESCMITVHTLVKKKIQHNFPSTSFSSFFSLYLLWPNVPN